MSRLPRSLTVAVIAAFLAKVVIALTTHGSTDVLLFEADVIKMERDGVLALYRDGISTEWCGREELRSCPPFNHPPFMARVLEAWAFLGQLPRLPMRFWLRLCCAIADVGSVVLLARILRRHLREPRARPALLWFTLSPIAIIVSGFHGNTDPIWVFVTLLAIDLLEQQRPAWLAGAVVGAAMSIKIVPVLLVPVMALSLPAARHRVAFGAGLAGTFLAGSLPVLLQAPGLVGARVFGYSSQSGSWGLSLLSLVLEARPALAWLGEAYLRYGKGLSVALVLGASLWPRPRPDTVFFRAGLVMLLFVSVIPGFGVQYLVWPVPWVVALGSGVAALYLTAATALLIGYYSTAAGTFPWYLANSLARPAWTVPVVLLGLACWIIVCAITLLYARRLAAGRLAAG